MNEDIASSKYFPIRQSIVAVLSRTGEIVGAGFLVSGQRILTCAHVLRSSGLAFDDHIKLRLFDGSQLTAKIDANYYRDPEEEDLALLHLSDEHHFNASPLTLGSSQNIENHKFVTFGFPKGHSDALFGKGIIDTPLGKVNLALVQLTSQEITNGFSGSPVFDLNTQCVIGIINERTKIDLEERRIRGEIEFHPSGRLGSTAFATPSSVIHKIFPELVIEAICPYCGLSAFTEEESQFFYGRDNLIEILSERLRKYPSFLVVTGASGSGKSSIVQAKVLPKLRSGEIIGFQSGTTIVSLRLSEEDTPESSLFSAFEKVARLSSDKAANWNILSKNIGKYKENRIVIFIDQFEELFSHYSPQFLKSSNFLGRLSSLLDENLNLTVILTMRTEFDPQLEASALGNRLTQASVLVRSIEGEYLHLKDTIINPAKDVGLEVEEALETSIIRDLGNTENPLPLLEFTLTELWKRDHEKNRLSYDTYKKIGGVTGALFQWANRFYDYDLSVPNCPKSRSELQKTLIRRILFRLVKFGSGDAPDIRRRVSKENLEKLGASAPTLLAQMASTRIVVININNTVELIHDSLINEWLKQGELGRLLEEKRRFFLWHQRFEEDFNDWENIKTEKNLLPDTYLGTALDYKETYPDDLSEDEKFYILESQRRVLRRRNRLILGLSGGLAAMSVTALFAGWQWTQAEIQKNTAKSIQLATLSEINLETDTTKSLILALFATKVKPTPEAEIALGRAFYSNYEISYLRHSERVTYGEYSPEDDGKILTIASDNTALIWKNNDINLPCVLRGHSQLISSASFAPSNPSLVLTTSHDSTAIIWDAEQCKQILRLEGHSAPINYGQFDPNNPEKVITAGSDQKIMIWDLRNPEKPYYVLQAHESEIWKAKFNPSNSNQVVSVSSDGNAKVWDLGNLNESVTLAGHQGQITDVFFDSHNSQRIMTVSNDRTARVWNLDEPANPAVLVGHKGSVRAGDFHPNNSNEVVTVSQNGIVYLWNLKEPNRPVPLLSEISQAIHVKYNREYPNQLLIVGSNGTVGRAEVWDTDSKVATHSLIGHKNTVRHGRFKPKTANQILTVGDDATARVWDISSKSIFEVPKREGIIAKAIFSPEVENQLLTINKSGEIKKWDIAEKVISGSSEQLRVRNDSIIGADFNPENVDEVMTVNTDGEILLWNLAISNEATKIALINDKALNIHYSISDPKKALVITENGVLTVHDLTFPNRKPIVLSVLPHRTTFGRFNPQNSNEIISVSDDGSIRIWNLQNISRPILEKRVKNDIFWFAGYNPSDPNIFFAGGRNRRLWLWDRSSNYDKPLELESHRGVLLYGVVNPENSSQLITSGQDQSIKIWNLKYPYKPVTLQNPNEIIIDILFSPDNSDKMLTLSESGRLRVYVSGGQKLIDKSLIKLSRCLSELEISEVDFDDSLLDMFEALSQEDLEKNFDTLINKPYCRERNIS